MQIDTNKWYHVVFIKLSKVEIYNSYNTKCIGKTNNVAATAFSDVQIGFNPIHKRIFSILDNNYNVC